MATTKLQSHLLQAVPLLRKCCLGKMAAGPVKGGMGEHSPACPVHHFPVFLPEDFSSPPSEDQPSCTVSLSAPPEIITKPQTLQMHSL